jgi:hypothetical protein
MKFQQKSSLLNVRLLTFSAIDGLATGVYSNLPADLRQRHEGSLGSKGLVREGSQDIDGKEVDTFQITAKGKEVLARALE